MKVFLSWSGERSKAIAELFNEWLCCVIQAAKPWISTKDVEKGSFWFSEISNQLQNTTVGIVCLTPENISNPWILFEAGALTKGLSNARVCTLLIDLEPKDIKDPLAQFNHTIVKDKNSMRELFKTINNTLGEHTLDISILDRAFETYWEQFREKFSAIIKKKPTAIEPSRPNEDVLDEILEHSRLTIRKIRELELQLEKSLVNRNIDNERNYLPLRVVRSIVSDFVKENMPTEMILDRLSHRAPRNIILDMIQSAKELQDLENIKDIGQ